MVAKTGAAEPDVAVDAAGTAVATWTRSNEKHELLPEAALSTAPGAWTARSQLAGLGGTQQLEPEVTIDGAGAATASWEALSGGKMVVFGADMSPAGAWSGAQAISTPGENAERPSLTEDNSGDALASWVREHGKGVTIVEAAARPAGGAWQPDTAISNPAFEQEHVAVAIDEHGDGVATWERELPENSNDQGVQAAGYDASGPALNGLAIPAAGVAGTPIALAVSPFDVWAALGATTWSFGDGATASGTNVTHVYAVAGSHAITVTSTDVLGVTTSASAKIAIGPAPPLPLIAPVLSALKQSASRWREGRLLASISATRKKPRKPPIGTTFSFTLNEPATVTLVFTRPASGRRVGRKCLAKSRHNKHHRRCTRTVTAGTLVLPGRAGANKIRFQGRISKHDKLKPGSYTVSLTATSTRQRSQSKSLHFTILG